VLLLVQGMQLHFHVALAHPAPKNHAHVLAHIAGAEIDLDHHGTADEVPVTSAAILKDLKLGSLMAALLFVVVLVLALPFIISRLRRSAEPVVTRKFHYAFTPPLRAPPR